MLVLVLVLHRGAVTVSSTGAENQIQGDDNGHVGRPCEVSLAPPYPEPFASYGTSAVTRTSDRGHVAEASNHLVEKLCSFYHLDVQVPMTRNPASREAGLASPAQG